MENLPETKVDRVVREFKSLIRQLNTNPFLFIIAVILGIFSLYLYLNLSYFLPYITLKKTQVISEHISPAEPSATQTHLDTPGTSPTITSKPNTEDNPIIPLVWHDPTLGIDFVKVAGKNYWIGKNEITIGEFKQYFSETGFTDVDQNQSPGCVSIGFPEKGKTRSSDAVACVSLKEALKFADWLTEKNNGGTFSLPTSSDWQAACYIGLINSSALEWCSNKIYPHIPDDPTYFIVGTPSKQSPLDCNYTDSGYALQRRGDVGFRLVWRP